MEVREAPTPPNQTEPNRTNERWIKLKRKKQTLVKWRTKIKIKSREWKKKRTRRNYRKTRICRCIGCVPIKSCLALLHTCFVGLTWSFFPVCTHFHSATYSHGVCTCGGSFNAYVCCIVSHFSGVKQVEHIFHQIATRKYTTSDEKNADWTGKRLVLERSAIKKNYSRILNIQVRIPYLWINWPGFWVMQSLRWIHMKLHSSDWHHCKWIEFKV